MGWLLMLLEFEGLFLAGTQLPWHVLSDQETIQPIDEKILDKDFPAGSLPASHPAAHAALRKQLSPCFSRTSPNPNRRTSEVPIP